MCNFLAQGWSSELLPALVGGIWSALVEAWPWLNGWFSKLPSLGKKGVMLAFGVALGLVFWGLSMGYGCADIPGWRAVIDAAFAAFAGSQVAYMLGTPKLNNKNRG